jgi:hypothetical protein
MNNATGENNPKTRNAWLKQSLVIGLTFWLGVVPGIGVAQQHGPRTFAIEIFVSRTYNYLDKMVDKDGLPYFNIFWTDPAEAAHDWPDFGDVMSRQLQAAVMARRLTGKEAQNEKLWTKKVLSYLDPTTGLLVRPKTSFSQPVADAGDQALTLYALVTVYADTKDHELKSAIDRMVEHLSKLHNPKDPLRGVHRQEFDDLGAADRLQACLGTSRKACAKLLRRESAIHA